MKTKFKTKIFYISDKDKVEDEVSYIGKQNMKNAMSLRSIYGPAHFGNFYEMMAPLEFQALCRTWQKNGINGYATWFDPYDVPDPFSDDPMYFWPRHKAMHLWRRKLSCLKMAQNLGLKITIYMTPNAVYIDQLKPELYMDSGDKKHIIGPNLCPAHPETRELLRKNIGNLMKFLREGGVKVDFVSIGFYDWGGCDCEKCRPWVKTALTLCAEDWALAVRQEQSDAKLQLSTWDLNEKEMDWFEELIAGNPDWLDGITISPGYETDWMELNVSEPYRKTLFLHISYSSQSSDHYGRTGMLAAPARLETIFRKCAKDGDIDGFQAYSEGVYDELNKFLIGRLGQDPLLNVRDLVTEYCRCYFATDDNDTEKLVDVIYRIEQLTKNPADAASLAEILETIGKKYDLYSNWRFEMMRIRAKVDDLNYRIEGPDEWKAALEKLDAKGKQKFVENIDKLVLERQVLLEHLQRDVYRIGMQITVMHMDLEHQKWQNFRWGVEIIDNQRDRGNFIA